MAARRNDERERLREATRDEIADLRDADVDDETSEVMVDVAAKAAARTARRMSQPDSDAPAVPAWHQRPVAKGSALLVILSAIAAAIEVLRQAGFIK